MKLSSFGIFALLSTQVLFAQGAPAPRVSIPVIVTDSHHNPVGGLTSASLVVQEHDTPVTDFSLLAGADLPL